MNKISNSPNFTGIGVFQGNAKELQSLKEVVSKRLAAKNVPFETLYLDHGLQRSNEISALEAFILRLSEDDGFKIVPAKKEDESAVRTILFTSAGDALALRKYNVELMNNFKKPQIEKIIQGKGPKLNNYVSVPKEFEMNESLALSKANDSSGSIDCPDLVFVGDKKDMASQILTAIKENLFDFVTFRIKQNPWD